MFSFSAKNLRQSANVQLWELDIHWPVRLDAFKNKFLQKIQSIWSTTKRSEKLPTSYSSLTESEESIWHIGGRHSNRQSTDSYTKHSSGNQLVWGNEGASKKL